MPTAQHNTSFLSPSKNQGFALMTELASLMIFGFGMLALSTLSEKNSQCQFGVTAKNTCKLDGQQPNL